MHLLARIFLYLLLLIPSHFSMVSSDDIFKKAETLQVMLKKSSGIFVSAERQVGLERTVLVTGCNYGFINHLQNFKCFADRLGLKFLVIALDERSYLYLTKHSDMNVYYMSVGSDKLSDAITSDSTTFRSKQFNLITARKKEAVHDILSLGYDVIFSDTDVAILKDPTPYLLWKNVDYVHSLNAPCEKTQSWDFYKSKVEGNTGLYFVRSNNRTIKMWSDAFEAVPKYPGMDDQSVFWNVIRKSKDPPIHPIGTCRHLESAPTVQLKNESVNALSTCFLDTCLFSSGMLSDLYVPEYSYGTLMENLLLANETIVTLHANYIKGNSNKANKMKEYGFWLKKGENQNSRLSQGQTPLYENSCIPYIPFNMKGNEEEVQ